MQKILPYRELFQTLILAIPVLVFLKWFWLPNLAGYNSDHAIHVLMVESFQFPQDLYYWGQNRLGSFLPMLGVVFSWFGLSPYDALAAGQFVLLLFIYLLFQRYFKSWAAKFAIAVLCFAPIFPFQNQVQPGHPVLAQLFFLGLFFYVHFSDTSPPKKAFLLPFLAAMAVWSSELSIIPVFFLSVFYFKTLRFLFLKYLKPALFGLSLGVAWIFLAKRFSKGDGRYDSFFTSYQNFKAIVAQHLQDVWHLLHFDTNKPGNSVVVLLIVLLFVLLLIKLGKKLFSIKLFWFFLSTSIGIYLAICASNWNFIMGRPMHHFTPAYFFLILALAVGWQEKNYKKEWFQLLPFWVLGIVHLVATCLFFSNFRLDLDDRMDQNQAKIFTDKIQREFPNQKTGLIGSYWNTYNIDALSENVISVPHQGEYIRTKRFVSDVFESQTIVLIRTGWLEELPLKIEQFGYTLQKTSGNYQLDTFEYAYYSVVKKPDLR